MRTSLNYASLYKIRSLLEQGKKYNEIAKELNLPFSEVRRVKPIGFSTGWRANKERDDPNRELSEREMLERRIEVHKQRMAPEDKFVLERLEEQLRATG